MAAAANKNKYAYAPSRVYSYARTAVAEALPEYEPEGSPREPRRPAPSPVRRTHPSAQTRLRRDASPSAKRKQRFLPKLFSVTAVFMMAAMLIYIIIRYASITAEWSKATDTQALIDESRRRITQLEVQLDAAADIEAARQAAREAGMDYPSAEQIVEVKGAASGGN